MRGSLKGADDWEIAIHIVVKRDSCYIRIALFIVHDHA